MKMLGILAVSAFVSLATAAQATCVVIAEHDSRVYEFGTPAGANYCNGNEFGTALASFLKSNSAREVSAIVRTDALAYGAPKNYLVVLRGPVASIASASEIPN